MDSGHYAEQDDRSAGSASSRSIRRTVEPLDHASVVLRWCRGLGCGRLVVATSPATMSSSGSEDSVRSTPSTAGVTPLRQNHQVDITTSERISVVTDPTEKAPEAEAASDSAPRRFLSPSGASTFRQCARRWRFRYVDKLPDPPGVPALVGTFVHRVLEELLAADGADRTVDHAKLIARAVWPEIEENPAFIDLALEPEAGRRVRWDAWRLVEGYFGLEDPVAVDVVEREQRLECDLDGVPFVGVVDLVERRDGRQVVTDYKTGKAPSQRFQDDRLHQVQLYAAALGAMGQPVERARLLYVRSRSIDTDVTDTSTGEAVEKLQTTWSDIHVAENTDEFAPTVGPLCNWCPYQPQCSEGRAEVERRYGPPV
ncbi:MAG: PD-(D/E)XK nuclease family protein [Actinobacteria bacterium]|nr:PD-(D/E)XK nuclease family protein [Actinomycetota bacterium]